MATPRSQASALLGIPMPRRPLSMARKPPASEPTPPPAPVRRAEQIEPEAPPATLAEPEMIRVLIVDPGTQTIAEAKLPVEDGNAEAGSGAQIKQDALTAVIGSNDLEWTGLADGLTAVVERGDYGDSDAEAGWRFGEDGEQMAGRAIIGGYDSETDMWIDAALTLDETREMIVWGADEEGEEEVASSYREQRAR